MIELDGAQGEAGGQVLRSVLALAICMQLPFRMTNIRIHRDMPGLLRQHLAAINAAADVSNADTTGVQLGSRELTFRPRRCRGGKFSFDIGASASCSLVLQTILPALLLAEAPSAVSIKGGTHHGNAPSFDHLQRAFLPALERMGARINASLTAYGFPPASSGGLQVDIEPSALTALSIHERGARISAFAEVFIAGLPNEVGQRQLATIGRQLHWSTDQLHLRTLSPAVGRGTAVAVTLAYQHVTEVFSGFTDSGVGTESVAQNAASQADRYLNGVAPVGPFLADQLLVPLALSGIGSFTTSALSAHFRSNAAAIEQFTGRRIVVEPRGDTSHVTIA